MDKGYERAKESIQVEYTLASQLWPDGLMRYWVQNRRGMKVTISTTDINKAAAEAERLNEVHYS